MVSPFISPAASQSNQELTSCCETQRAVLRWKIATRVWRAKGYGSFRSAWRTLQGIETMHMINKGRVRWLSKGDAVGQAHFVASLFGIAA